MLIYSYIFKTHKNYLFVCWLILIIFVPSESYMRFTKVLHRVKKFWLESYLCLIYMKFIHRSQKMILCHFFINFNSISSIYVTNIIHYSVNWAEIKIVLNFVARCRMSSTSLMCLLKLSVQLTDFWVQTSGFQKSHFFCVPYDTLLF